MAQPPQQSFRSNSEVRRSNQAMAQTVRTAELIPYRDGGHASRVVEIRGRLSGRVYEVPLAVITVFGGNYLVSPSANRNWVRNLTASPNCVVVSRDAREHRYAVRVIDQARATEVTSTYLSLTDAPWDVAQFPFTSDSSISETLARLDQLAVFELTQLRSPVLTSLAAQ